MVYVYKQNSEQGEQLWIASDNEHPYCLICTPFVLKSINCNKFDSLHLNNIFIKAKSDIYDHDINNYNDNLPLIVEGSGSKQTKFMPINCNDINNINKTIYQFHLIINH